MFNIYECYPLPRWAGVIRWAGTLLQSSFISKFYIFEFMPTVAISTLYVVGYRKHKQLGSRQMVTSWTGLMSLLSTCLMTLISTWKFRMSGWHLKSSRTPPGYGSFHVLTLRFSIVWIFSDLMIRELKLAWKRGHICVEEGHTVLLNVSETYAPVWAY